MKFTNKFESLRNLHIIDTVELGYIGFRQFVRLNGVLIYRVD